MPNLLLILAALVVPLIWGTLVHLTLARLWPMALPGDEEPRDRYESHFPDYQI